MGSRSVPIFFVFIVAVLDLINPARLLFGIALSKNAV